MMTMSPLLFGPTIPGTSTFGGGTFITSTRTVRAFGQRFVSVHQTCEELRDRTVRRNQYSNFGVALRVPTSTTVTCRSNAGALLNVSQGFISCAAAAKEAPRNTTIT